MRSFELQYLADCIVVEAMLEKKSDGALSSLISGITSFVKSQWNPEQPASSVAAFIAPGLLFSLEFPWIATFYMVAEALGFDWKGFFNTVGTSVANLFSGSTATKPAEQVKPEISSIVSSAWQDHMTGNISMDKLRDLAYKSVSAKRHILTFKTLTTSHSTNQIIKLAGIGSFIAKFSGFFIKVITWLITTGLISLGLVSATGAVSGLLGLNKDKEQDTALNPNQLGFSTSSYIKPADSTPSDFFDNHNNNPSSIWMEKGDIDNLPEILKAWILQAYPQVEPYISNVIESQSFISMLNKFQERNRLAQGTDLISIPQPYERKIDIVSDIMAPILKTNNG